MITSTQCLARYGKPETERFMVLWDVPHELEIGVIPKRIYCNREIVEPLKKAFHLLILSNCVMELKTWDGCFNIRKKKGGGASTPSLHSWGIAVDINAAWNRQGQKPTLSPKFVECFDVSGFDWGGRWGGNSVDGMHFQLKQFPT